MGISIKSVKCPECSAVLPVEDGRNQFFCSYCGAKIILTNDNEYIYRHIDDAEVKQAETEQLVKLKQLELAEKRRLSREAARKKKALAALFFAIVGILVMIGGSLTDNESFFIVGLVGLVLSVWIGLFAAITGDDDQNDVVAEFGTKIPDGIDDFEGANFVAVESLFKAAGFKHVQCIPLHDLSERNIGEQGRVEAVTINGEEVCPDNKRYDPEAPVVITYHCVT